MQKKKGGGGGKTVFVEGHTKCVHTLQRLLVRFMEQSLRPSTLIFLHILKVES